MMDNENPAREDSPVNIGSRLELFVDRHIADTLQQTTFRLHHPQRLPLAQSPISGGYMSVFKDGNLYRAYFRDNDPAYTGKHDDRIDGNDGEFTAYAQSPDGHEWTRPELDLHEIAGSRANSAILAKHTPFTHNFAPCIDTRPDVEPESRFKALGGTHPGGLFAYKSGDGIHWERLWDEAVITSEGKAFDSQNVSFWSAAEECYVCYFRSWFTPYGRFRTISRTTSSDYIHWTAPIPMNPNLPAEDLYVSGTHPYFRAPHIYVALPTRFIKDRGSSTDILFMSTRAGSTSYERLFTEAFIRPGLDRQRWGNRANYAAFGVVPTSPTEMSIYHGNSGHRYVLRIDGFTSINAGREQGEFITKPLIFTGEKLVANYSTSAAGSLQVEIQHPDGTPIPGFSLEDGRLNIGDEIDGAIGWTGNGRLGNLADQPVRLRFVMRECDLFSIQFR
ncbi:MAG: hypothetical protein HN368_13840 [Spirochaetales bacterium]|jgi:hypothetical protein|nr:hypothetical protein [Spirochaetales bacterium]